MLVFKEKKSTKNTVKAGSSKNVYLLYEAVDFLQELIESIWVLVLAMCRHVNKLFLLKMVYYCHRCPSLERKII